MEANFEFLKHQNKNVDFIPRKIEICDIQNGQVSLLEMDPYAGLVEVVYAIKTMKGGRKIQKILVIPKDKTITPIYRNCYYNFGGFAVGFHVYGYNKRGNSSYYYPRDYMSQFKLCIGIELEKVRRRELFNIDDILKLCPQYKYCGYNEYSGIYAIDYLGKLDNFPICEMLMKLNIHRMWDEKALEFIQKNKPFQKYLFKFQKEIKQNNMAFTTVKNAFKKNPEIAPDNYYNSLKYRIECGKRNAGIQKDIYQKILKHTTQEKIQDYISNNKIGSDTYGDYLRACDWLRLDFADTKVLFPKDFFKWHDDYTQQYAEYVAKKEKEAKTQLSESLKKVAMKYSFVEKNLCGFFVIVAKSKEDLIYEGELLKHCVGKMGYDKKQANEESLICFIRKDKKTPFVTCELDLKTLKIRQCYGINNTQIIDPDFIQFKEEWLKVIRKEYKKAVAT
ncbi:MAG: hypothetical protein E7063_03105 [Spirochaetaceae bacterium]|nr:hypothetical protein [Spirochaetaceae bacterium]